MTISTDATTVSEARAWLLEAREGGTKCPCCGQHVQVYKRHLNYSMAHVLFLLYEYFTHHEGWLHVPSYLNGKGVAARGGDWAKLAHWGLIVRSGEERQDGSARVGKWRITSKGERFMEKAISVPAYYLSYNNTILGWAERQLYVDEALRKAFDYCELMQGVRRPPPRDPQNPNWPPPGFR